MSFNFEFRPCKSYYRLFSGQRIRVDNIEEKTIQSSEFDGNLLKAQALMWIICDGTKKWLRRIKKKKYIKIILEFYI